MQLIKFILDMQNEIDIQCKNIPRKGEEVIINRKTYKVGMIIHDLGYNTVTVYLLSEE